MGQEGEAHAGVLQPVVENALERLGALSSSHSQGLLPPALQPALEHTLACVDEDAEDGSEIDLDSAQGTLKGGKGAIASLQGTAGVRCRSVVLWHCQKQ